MLKTFFNKFDTRYRAFLILVHSMVRDAWCHRHGWRRRVESSSWRYIPSVSRFELETKRHNIVLQWFGIDRKLESEKDYDTYPETKRMNKYIRYQVIRLRKLRNQPELFWHVASRIIIRSKCFRVAALNQVLLRWYRLYPLEFIFIVNRRVIKLLKSWDTQLKYRRVYIPKSETDPSKGLRPLGVPTPEWRVVLHMWNNMLGIFLEDKLSPRQHGFQPGKGTKTAWADLLSKIHKYKYVYEIDLKGCFPNIDFEMIISKLRGLGTPYRITKFIEELAERTPIFKSKSGKGNAIGVNDAAVEDTDQAILNKIAWNQFIGETDIEIATRGWAFEKKMGYSDAVKFVNGLLSVDVRRVSIDTADDRTRNLPQGSPTSPLLTIFGLNEFVQQCEDAVFYADDGIFLSNSPIVIKDDPANGIFIHPQKSKYVVFDGKPQCKLKFLGLTYDIENKVLAASTRKGATLEIKDSIFKLLEFISWFLIKFTWIFKSRESLRLARQAKEMAKLTRVDRLFQTGISGYVIAALYTNRYNLSNHVEDIDINPKSWVSRYSSEDRRLWSTNSSAACKWLIRKL